MQFQTGMVRALIVLGAVAVLGCDGGKNGLTTIHGSARLPDCAEAPGFDLDGTRWIDSGAVTVGSAGCGEAVGTVRAACPLAWEISQAGREVTLVVDGEYRLLGRACGQQLHLEGGWWLTVEDAAGACDYEDGLEVGLSAGGATLDVAASLDALTGTLRLAEKCTATYDVTFSRSGAQ